jgi:ABC-type transporter Mla subunit MlaD
MRRLALTGVAILAAVVVAVAGAGPSQGAGGPYLVRAIFDNAEFAVPGENVRIAGANVGTIQSLAVTDKEQAAMTLAITDTSFRPWYANATCAIRPQSLIAENYVDCEPGSSNEPALTRITSGGGSGQYLLPVTQTSEPVDFDIVQDISQESLRQRLSIILDELGTGLAARGADLNAVIHRADPALGRTDQVFKILAHQNKVLAQLASDSDAVLTPLAKVREQIAGFIVQANTAAVASAQRATDISRSFQLLPPFLRELRPLMVDLGQLAQQGTPLMASLASGAEGIDREFAKLIPFAKAARPALITLGNSAQQSQPAFIASEPLARRLRSLGSSAEPAASLLSRLTESLESTGAIQQLMGVLFNATGATNGFDSDGHYVRTEPLVGGCTAYKKTPTPGCSANFGSSSAAADEAAARSLTDAAGAGTATAGTGTPGTSTATGAAASIVRQAIRRVLTSAPTTITGLLRYLIGGSR